MSDQGGDETTSLSFTELQAVFHSVNDAIFIYDRDGEIIDVNRAAAEMYGYTRSWLREMTAGAISSGKPPYTGETASERVRRAAEGESLTFEWQGEDSDGRVFWEEVSLSRTVIDGEVRVIAIVRDISDKREAEQRFQTLIDNLPGVVYRCRGEPGWPMLYVGGQCEELTGYSADALESGEVVWGKEVLHPDEREHMREEVESALAADEPFELTYRIRRADGEVRWVPHLLTISSMNKIRTPPANTCPKMSSWRSPSETPRLCATVGSAGSRPV